MPYQDDIFGPHQQEQVKEQSQFTSTALNIAKVFLYVFIGLAITTAVAFGVGAYVFYSYTSGTDITPYIYVLLGSLILLLIDSLVIHLMAARGRHSIMIPGILYCLLLGTTLSFLTLVIDWTLLGMALGITSLAFLLMSAISFLTKGRLSGIVVAIIGLGAGIGLLSLMLWIYALATGTILGWIYWAIILGSFALVMFITIYDLWRVKKIAEQGQMNNNIALYCAFIIYTDFINVFLRILYFLLLIFGRRR